MLIKSPMGARSPTSAMMLHRAARCVLIVLLIRVCVHPAGSLADSQSGQLVGWGTDYFGQPIIPEGLSNVTHIALGREDEAPWGIALLEDSLFVGWGSGATNTGEWPEYGQRVVPDGIENVVALSAGAVHCIALQQDGTAVVWGHNLRGQTNAVGLTNLVAVAAGDSHSLALRADGSVIAWGDNFRGQCDVPDGLTNVVAIAGGGDFSLALRSDGTVAGWGRNWIGQTDVPADLTNAVSIAAGHWHALALKSDGTVVGWGDNRQGQASPPAGLSNVVSIAVGLWHSLALKADGTVVAWGKNNQGQDSPPDGLSNVVAIAGGSLENAAIRVDFKITELQVSEPSKVISFQSFAGKTYALESAPEIDSDQWSEVLGATAIGNGQVISLADTNTAGDSIQRYYRLRIVP